MSQRKHVYSNETQTYNGTRRLKSRYVNFVFFS